MCMWSLVNCFLPTRCQGNLFHTASIESRTSLLRRRAYAPCVEACFVLCLCYSVPSPMHQGLVHGTRDAVAIVQVERLRRLICTIKHLAHKTAMPHCMHACTALHVSRGTLDRVLHINNNMQYNAVPAKGLVTCLPQCFDRLVNQTHPSTGHL